MSQSIRDIISGVLLIIFPTLIVGLTRFYVQSMPNIEPSPVLYLFSLIFQTDWLLVAFIGVLVGIYLARKHYALRTVLFMIALLLVLIVFIVYIDYYLGEYYCRPPHFTGTMDCTVPVFFGSVLIPNITSVFLGWSLFSLKYAVSKKKLG